MTIARQAAGARRFAADTIGMESRSGTGSTMAATVAVRKWLPHFCWKRSIATLLDLPCGDHHWMASVELPRTRYTGADVIEDVVREAKRNRPDREFAVLNVLTDPVGKHDLIMCRDLLVHLDLSSAATAVRNFIESKSKYLAVTDFPDAKINSELCEAQEGWGWRQLNMTLEPFEMTSFVDGVCEDYDSRKFLNVYRIN